jgi:hypothetical protein
MKAAHPADWPKPPHLGGPPPKIHSVGRVRVGLRCAELFAEQVPRELRARYDRAVDLTRKSLAFSREGKSVSDAARACTGSPWLAIAQGAANAASYPSGSNWRELLNPAVAETVKALAGLPPGSKKRARSNVQVREFLSTLDDFLLEQECIGILAERAITPRSEIGRVLLRQRTDDRGLAAILVELEDGGEGLLVKLKGRWTWHEGSRDELVATVPDAYFKRVVESLGK